MCPILSYFIRAGDNSARTFWGVMAFSCEAATSTNHVGRRDVGRHVCTASARLLHGLTALRGAVAHLHPVVVAPNPDLTWPFSKFWTVWLVWLWNTLDMSGWSFIHVFISIQFTWSVEVSCQIKSSNQTSSLLQSTQSFISRASLTFPRSRVVPASSHSNNIVLNSSYRDAATIQNQCSDCAVTGDRLLVATGLMKDFLRNCSIFCTGLSGFLCNMSHFAPLNLRGFWHVWISFESLLNPFLGPFHTSHSLHLCIPGPESSTKNWTSEVRPLSPWHCPIGPGHWHPRWALHLEQLMRLSFIICYKKHHLHSFDFMFHKRSYIKCYIFDPGKLQWPLLPANKHNMT